MAYNDSPEQIAARGRSTLIITLVGGGLAIVALTIICFTFLAANGHDANVRRTTVEACSKSPDVTACLKAVNGGK